VINKSIAKFLACLMLAFLFVGCAGESGAPNEVDTIIEEDNSDYNGPQAATTATDFKLYFWDPITGQGSHDDKCVDCHDVGGQAPSKFANTQNVNDAFTVAFSGYAANSRKLVDFTDPANSEIVQRVANGHNCWVAPDYNFCRDALISYIESWRDGSEATSTVVQLTAPVIADPDPSKEFPADSADFGNTIWPILTANCANCHSDTAALAQRQSPYFASADVDLAYEQAKTKIDLANPADSRLVVRLRDEFHNCWSGDCSSDANDMLLAIQAFAGPIPETAIDPAIYTSKALRLLQDGIVAASGGRVETDIIALYEFKQGAGSAIVRDSSDVAPRADLILSGTEGVDYEWLNAWGIQFSGGKAQATVADSKKIFDMIQLTSEYSVEAWVAPGNVTQEGPARIVSYSAGDNRNFMLGQTLYNYNFPARSSASDPEGMPMLSTDDNDEDLQATLQHVVVTYRSDVGRQIYVNGVHTGDVDTETNTSIGNWNDGYALVLGSEVDGSNVFAGSIRLVAIHNRALTQQSIQANYDAGVGQKFFLLFSVTHLLNTTPDAFIVFEVSEYDNYSYLFGAPYFISLDNAVTPETFDIQGMRIGINGKIASVGQAYVTMDTEVNGTVYVQGEGQPLSSVGTVIALENGADQDQFFLTFDRIGDNTNVLVEADPPDPVFEGSAEQGSDIGVRNFSEINQSFAQITGISSTTTSVENVYNAVVQQLPSSEDIQGYLSSHQMGVTQLGIAYCDALIESPAARVALGISLPEIESGSDDANSKSVAAWDADFITPMMTAAMNSSLSTQPSATQTRELVHHLLFTDADGIAEIDPVNDPDPHGLSRCGGGCPVGRTAEAAKAACASILGSAAVTFQ